MPNYLSKLVLNGVEYVLRAAASVTGVKGDNESSYRTGDVIITKDNIGLGNVGNYKAVSTNANQGLSDTEKSQARANIGAGTSSFSGSYNDLSNKPTIPAAQVQSNWTQTTTTATDYIKNKPTLGTASAKDVSSSGNASTSQVVMGNDTRLSDSRNAKDVSSWAKASTKPTYTYSEVGAAAASHNQASNTITSMTGYSKASSAGSIATTDSLNTALGKLEKTLDGKASNSAATQSAQGLMSAADKQKLDSLTKVPSGRYHLTFGKST